MNKHPINHVFQGIKHPITSQVRPDFTSGLGCYLCTTNNGDDCSVNPNDKDYYNISGTIVRCDQSQAYKAGNATCSDCSEKRCPDNVSCLAPYR